MDRYLAKMDAMGAVIALTADHGMNAKTKADGTPNVIYLQDAIDGWIGKERARVILPITDPYVVHHGRARLLRHRIPRREGSRRCGREARGPGRRRGGAHQRRGLQALRAAPDRVGDLVVVSKKHVVLGTSASRHDLSGLDAPLRSHGGISEQVVPLLFNRRAVGMPQRRLRKLRHPRHRPQPPGGARGRHRRGGLTMNDRATKQGVIEVRYPFTGEIVGTVRRASVEDVRRRSHGRGPTSQAHPLRARQHLQQGGGAAARARRRGLGPHHARVRPFQEGLDLRGRARLDVFTFSAMEALRDDGQAFSCDLTPHGKNRRVYTRASRCWA
jgi:hypothetical protein